MNEVILYSTHCPKCNALAMRLSLKKIEYTEVNDVDVMMDKGFMSAPMLEVDGQIMNYTEATKWINNN